MQRWTIGGLAVACAGCGVYLLVAKPEAPAPAAPPEVVVAPPAPSAPPPPAVLAEVVEMTDLDPLLDPPTRADAGTPFDADPPAPTAAAAPAPAVIPPAVD